MPDLLPHAAVCRLTFAGYMLLYCAKGVLNEIELSDQVSDQVKKLLQVLDMNPLSASELMQRLDLSHRATFRKNYLHPAIAAGLIEMTPDKPNSRLQKYRITPQGKNRR